MEENGLLKQGKAAHLPPKFNFTLKEMLEDLVVDLVGNDPSPCVASQKNSGDNNGSSTAKISQKTPTSVNK